MMLGENIKLSREKAGITQKKLADEVGVTNIMIHQYERNLKTPRVEILVRIAEKLNTTPNDLIYGEPNREELA